ncbi:MAG: hypothetical protein ACYTGN_17110 [Planctomycetota bacterium]
MRWTFHPRWNISGGYRFYGQEFNEDELFNRLQLHRFVVGLAYMW